MLKIAICDDERKYIDEIELCINKFVETYPVEYDVFYSGEEILETYNQKYLYDVIIMDIELKGLCGIDVANMIREQDKLVNIFFLTSHTRYAIRCFKCSPKNFWIKPIKYEIFFEDMQEVYAEITQAKKYFCCNTEKQILKVECDKIMYLESDNKKIKIHTLDGLIEIKGALKNYAKQLENEYFLLCHSSFIVNLKYIQSMKDNVIILSNGDMLPVSKSKKKRTKTTLINYFNRGR